MKLGIVVVYLVSEGFSPLLDLHLSRIARHMTVPYTIYASANRLHPQLYQRLKQDLHVKIIDCPTTPERGSEEHSYYLEHLIRAAVEDKASHIVTLHVDSFPIRTGWAEDLAALLSDTCALVTIEHVSTACLFFSREFYLKYDPHMMLTAEDRKSPLFSQYIKEHKPVQHSGTGYGFKAFSEGLSCCYLIEDSYQKAGRDSLFDARGVPLVYLELSNAYSFAATYERMIFHLKGAVQFGDRIPSQAKGGGRSIALHAWAMNFLPLFWRTMIPARVRYLLWPYLAGSYGCFFEGHLRRAIASKFEAETAAFFLDPEKYIDELLAKGDAPR